MKMHRGVVGLVALVVALAAVTACSKSTSPGGGGGGTVAKELNSGTLGPGANYPHMFNTAGTFPYHCAFHGAPMSGMSGTITVTNVAAAPAAVSIVNNSFNPPSLSVGAGSTVTWTNNGSNNHTVTSD